jgi:predicted aldo/keto reductase-like oxidoreductase
VKGKMNTYFKEIKKKFESQLAACGVEYFDFYLMHAQSAEIYEKFKSFRAQGLIPCTA